MFLGQTDPYNPKISPDASTRSNSQTLAEILARLKKLEVAVNKLTCCGLNNVNAQLTEILAAVQPTP